MKQRDCGKPYGPRSQQLSDGGSFESKPFRRPADKYVESGTRSLSDHTPSSNGTTSTLINKGTSSLGILIVSAISANAQAPRTLPSAVHFEQRVKGVETPASIITNAPFSGQEVTVETPTLDGTTQPQQITTAQVYRDAQGRTRIDRSFTGVDPWSGGTLRNNITILDPVAQVAIFLDPQTRTALRLPLRPMPSSVPSAHPSQTATQVTTLDLGTQVIQGLPCTGTESTTTVPVGAVGNSQSIITTSQRWYSTDLQIVMDSTRTDSRRGEIHVSIQNLSRVAPDASLFASPANYTVTTVQSSSNVLRGLGSSSAGSRATQ